MNTALARVDAAWRIRDTKGFKPVEAALADARTIDALHPGVGWRTARLEVSLGLLSATDREAAAHFGAGREAGWLCVLDDPNVRGLQVEVGLQAGLKEVRSDRRPCAAWAALAWARWLGAFGADAGAIDSQRIDALLAGDQPNPMHATTARWARALHDGTRTVGNRDRVGSRANLLALANDPSDPTEGVARVDLWLMFDRQTQVEETRAYLTTKRPASPEARAYFAREREDQP